MTGDDYQNLERALRAILDEHGVEQLIACATITIGIYADRCSHGFDRGHMLFVAVPESKAQRPDRPSFTDEDGAEQFAASARSISKNGAIDE